VKRFLAVLLIVTLLLSGCAGEKQAEELIIPPSLEASQVTAKVFGFVPYLSETWSPGAEYYPELTGISEEGFISGVASIFDSGSYSNTRIAWERGNITTQSYVAVIFIVMKYENAAFAQRSYDSITGCEFENFTYNGIALKSGVYYPPTWEGNDTWGGASSLQCYLIHSGCFIIFMYGQEKPLKDTLEGIIEEFGN